MQQKVEHPDVSPSLVTDAKAGSEPAWRKLCERCLPLIVAVTLRKVDRARIDEELRKDLVQEVFLKMATGISTYDGRSKFTTWLFRVSLNVCFDHLRKEKRRIATVQADAEPAETIRIDRDVLLDFAQKFTKHEPMVRVLLQAEIELKPKSKSKNENKDKDKKENEKEKVFKLKQGEKRRLAKLLGISQTNFSNKYSEFRTDLKAFLSGREER